MAKKKLICMWTGSLSAWKKNQEYQREVEKQKAEKALQEEEFQREKDRIFHTAVRGMVFSSERISGRM